MLEFIFWKEPGIKRLAVASTALALFFSMSGILAGSELLIVLSIPAFAVPFALTHFYGLYLSQRRKMEIGSSVPEALLLASSMAQGTSPENAADFIACNSGGPVSAEFAKARDEMLAGMPPEEAFSRMAERSGSGQMKRAAGLMISGIESGAEMSAAFREAAEDIAETNAISMERAAATAMQKYTVLLGGAILVPFILGKLASLTGNFSAAGLGVDGAKGAFGDIGLGMIGNASEAARRGLMEAAGIGNIIYIAEFAVIASVFAAMQEGIPRKAVVYAVALLPIGLGVYFAAKGGV
ncbi:Type II secretion system (T2SS), protein F [uncultured archaeon]|nr:Type II secretion system (T2SS), protein F [uncultured archaeon]